MKSKLPRAAFARIQQPSVRGNPVSPKGYHGQTGTAAVSSLDAISSMVEQYGEESIYNTPD